MHLARGFAICLKPYPLRVLYMSIVVSVQELVEQDFGLVERIGPQETDRCDQALGKEVFGSLSPAAWCYR